MLDNVLAAEYIKMELTSVSRFLHGECLLKVTYPSKMVKHRLHVWQCAAAAGNYQVEIIIRVSSLHSPTAPINQTQNNIQ